MRSAAWQLAAGGQHAVGSFAHGPVQILSLTLRLLRGEKRWGKFRRLKLGEFHSHLVCHHFEIILSILCESDGCIGCLDVPRKLSKAEKDRLTGATLAKDTSKLDKNICQKKSAMVLCIIFSDSGTVLLSPGKPGFSIFP